MIHFAQSKLLLPIFIGVLVCGFSGCGAGFGNGSDGVLTVKTVAIFDDDIVRLRWFPVDEAEGYTLYVSDCSGALYRVEEAMPVSCTHQADEGFTSGVCLYDTNLTGVPRPVSLRIRAHNVEGEGLESSPALFF